MSKNQQLVLGVLGLAIVLVYGGLGAYALIYLTDGLSTQNGESPPVAGAELDAALASPCPITGLEGQPAPQPPDGAAPANTRVMPLTTPAPGEPAPAARAAPTQPAHTSPPETGPSPTPPAQATSTGPAAPTATPPPPPSPTPGANCEDEENAYHQEMLAEIEAEHATMLEWVQSEMEKAERDGDDMRIEELQFELDMYENLKAANIEAENARHDAALAACND